jgi:hypothetical protein
VALKPCSDLSPAAWITGSDVPWYQLVTFGPQAFRAYARLRFLPDPASPGQEEPTGLLGPDAPSENDLLGLALAVLGEHTHTPDDLYFCMWDGWGTPPALRGMPMVTVPYSQRLPCAQQQVRRDRARSYFLFSGTLADFADWDSPRMAGITPGDVPPPAFIWPADHAWCIALDVDPHYAGIGAAPETIAQLVAHPALDVVSADPTERQPYYT